ncbi:inositol monophosphatase family protein [Streptomyces sp. URMC 124]|uniref:inositol monophosphatase family protein n=1 Tax=Streptomyces sp. URMC 124 TaxID=3423405 RepID=UPI003F1CBEF0
MTSERLHVAREVARRASSTALEFFERPQVRHWSKGDGSLVTEADLATEEHVRRALAELAPGEEVLGEEYGGSPTGAGHWIVDPIDGTENFRRGVPIWGVLVAWRSGGSGADGSGGSAGSAGSGGEVTDAAVVAPALGRSWSASRGRGAHDGDGRPLRVSAVARRSEASFCYGGAHEYEPAEMAALGVFASGFRTAWGIGNFYAHMLVAEGAADGALSVGTSVWDVAAPSLIVAEAGGTWCDLGGRHDLGSGALLTTNGRIGTTLLEGVRTACPQAGGSR